MASDRNTMRTLARQVRTDERGMTLVEVLVAMTMGVVILFAAFTVMDGANTMQARTADRLDAVQRGRVAMERITRGIRAQQCLTSEMPAVEIASPYVMQFFSSVAPVRGGSQPMERRRIEWKADAPGTTTGFDDASVVVGDITETVWRSPSFGYPYVFPAAPTSTSIIAEDVQPPDGGKPIFNYYAYDIVKGVGRPSSTPLSTSGGKVADDFLDKIVMVDIRFLSRPRRGKRIKSFTVPFFNRVSVRTADPTDPDNSPLCTE